MNTTTEISTFNSLPSADPPAAVTLTAVDFFDSSQLYDQDLDPHARVNVSLGGRKLDTIILFAEQQILDVWEPPAGLTVTDREIEKAQAAADHEIETAHEMTHCMLLPIVAGNWSDVPARAPFRKPTSDFHDALYVWNDATQSGSAHAAEVIRFARDPRNNLDCFFYDTESKDWITDETPIEYEIQIADVFSAPYLTHLQFVVIQARRAGNLIGEATFSPGDFHEDGQESGIEGLPGDREARAIARSMLRAHVAGKLTSWPRARITAPAPDSGREVH